MNWKAGLSKSIQYVNSPDRRSRTARSTSRSRWRLPRWCRSRRSSMSLPDWSESGASTSVPWSSGTKRSGLRRRNDDRRGHDTAHRPLGRDERHLDRHGFRRVGEDVREVRNVAAQRPLRIRHAQRRIDRHLELTAHSCSSSAIAPMGLGGRTRVTRTGTANVVPAGFQSVHLVRSRRPEPRRDRVMRQLDDPDLRHCAERAGRNRQRDPAVG